MGSPAYNGICSYIVYDCKKTQNKRLAIYSIDKIVSKRRKSCQVNVIRRRCSRNQSASVIFSILSFFLLLLGAICVFLSPSLIECLQKSKTEKHDDFEEFEVPRLLRTFRTKDSNYMKSLGPAKMPASTIFSILIKKENAHNDPIYCCAWAKINTSGDSANVSKDFIVTGGLDCLVKVWILENNRLELLHVLEGHSMAVVSVAVSPSAPIIVSSSLDSTLIFWDLCSGKKLVEIPTGVTDVWKIAFSPDGEHIATGGHTGKIHVYQVQSGLIAKILDTRGKFILSISYSPNGRYIATGSEDGILCIVDVAQGKVVHTVQAHAGPVRSVAFSPCSRRLATASNDGLVKIYDVASAGVQHSLNHKCWAVSVCFTSEGTRVATAAADGTVRVAMTDGLTVLNTFKEHSDVVWGVNFNSNNKKILSVSKDKCINIYECPPLPPKAEKKEATMVK